jgi:hypothetical protein
MTEQKINTNYTLPKGNREEALTSIRRYAGKKAKRVLRSSHREIYELSEMKEDMEVLTLYPQAGRLLLKNIDIYTAKILEKMVK